MNISLCITTFNEEKSISRLLQSVYDGGKIPDEVVIVDGGSSDSTVPIIKSFQKKYKNINLIFKKGSIASGRNAAIAAARDGIIVQTDAGCVVKRDWLEKMIAPFKNEKGTDIVAGFYVMPANSPLQEAINVFHGVPPERFNPNTFIPSARSVAFKKTVWESIGGYSESLKRAGEDTLFFYEAVKKNFKIERVGDAKVIWEEAGGMSFAKSLNKFFYYAAGDSKTGIWWHPSKQIASHNIKISLIFLRYFVGAVILLFTLLGYVSPLLTGMLVLVYLAWPVYKWRDVVKTPQGRMYLPVVQIASDLAVMAGFLWGIL